MRIINKKCSCFWLGPYFFLCFLAFWSKELKQHKTIVWNLKQYLCIRFINLLVYQFIHTIPLEDQYQILLCLRPINLFTCSKLLTLQIKKLIERLRKLPWSVKIAMSDLEVDSSSLKFCYNSYEEEYITQTVTKS